MRLGLVIEEAPDERVISSLVARISKQSGCSVDIDKERIWYGRSFGSINKRLPAIVSHLQDAGSEVIVVVADNDRNPLNKRLNSLRSKIEEISIPVAVGIAVETIEAWLLTDELALKSTLEGTQITRLPLPSKIKYPKEKFLRLFKERAGRPVSLDDYSQIAVKADKRVLDRRCKSFKRFHNELKTCLRRVQSGSANPI